MDDLITFVVSGGAHPSVCYTDSKSAIADVKRRAARDDRTEIRMRLYFGRDVLVTLYYSRHRGEGIFHRTREGRGL